MRNEIRNTMENPVFISRDIMMSEMWEKSSETKITMLTMLMMADHTGAFQSSISGVSRMSGIPKDVTEKCIEELMNDCDIYRVDGGWGCTQRSYFKFKRSDRNVADAKYMRAYRAKKEVGKG